MTLFACAGLLLAASMLGSFASHRMRVYHTGFPEVTGVAGVLLAVVGTLQLAADIF